VIEVEKLLATQGVDAAEKLARSLAGPEAELALANVLLRKRGDDSLAEAEALLAKNKGPVARQLTGIAQARRGNARESLEAFEDAYKLADGDPPLRARILLAWGLQLRNFGLFEDAQRLAERSLEMRLQLDDQEGAAICYGTIAFIAQRQGRYDAERDALVADLRICEKLGNRADIPALQARLAGALVGLGKYAGAWVEADKAIALETELAGDKITRTHGFAWREQARVCLAGSRFAEGLALVDKALKAFAADWYGSGLVKITEAELALASGDRERARAAAVAGRPAFIALGALPELAETVLLEVEIDPERADEALVQRLLPALVTGGITSALHRRAKETLARHAASSAFERAAMQAAMLRGLAATAALDAPVTATVLAARVPALAEARRFVRAAVDAGAIVTVGVRDDSLAIFVGDRHEARAQRLAGGLSGLALGSASGEVELERLWPAGVRARGPAVTAALAALP
jgi:tetratricopeptide (TPR) repeat protein